MVTATIMNQHTMVNHTFDMNFLSFCIAVISGLQYGANKPPAKKDKIMMLLIISIDDKPRVRRYKNKPKPSNGNHGASIGIIPLLTSKKPFLSMIKNKNFVTLATITNHAMSSINVTMLIIILLQYILF